MNIVEPIRSKKELKDVEKILKEQNCRNLLLFVLGTNSGLRISDILSLNVKDVQDKDYIEIVEKKTNKQKKFPINTRLKSMFKRFT